MKNTFDDVIKNIGKNEKISDEIKSFILQQMTKLKNTKINLLVVGATGVGKSSTINALFSNPLAKVGRTPNPQTMDISHFELNNLVIWDSPGLGDGKEKDVLHAKKITELLLKVDENGDLLIDLVMVILDGASRDYGTAYEIINSVIIPNLGESKNRLLVAINKSDIAMQGVGWDIANNCPSPKLQKFLDQKITSTHERILEATGVSIEPICYTAGFKDEDEVLDERKPWNLSKLLYYVLQHTKAEKRIVFASDINRDEEVWERDDGLENYREKTKESLKKSMTDHLGAAAKGAALGAAIGSMIPVIGTSVGAAVGGAMSGLASYFGW